MDRGASGLQFLGSQSQTRLKQVSTHSGFSSVAQLCPTLVTPWIAALQAFLSFTISWSLLQLMSIESSCHRPSHSCFIHERGGWGSAKCLVPLGGCEPALTAP